MKRAISVTMALIFLAVFATALYAATPSITAADKKFANTAAMDGLYEVAAGKLAAEKATSPDVKKFGQRMVDDHSKANDELMKIAADKGMKAPTDMGSKNKSKMDKLSGQSGADFDKSYIKNMVSDHKTDVAAFKKEADKGKDPELKAFAGKTLPTLQEHLKMAEDTQKSMK
jgi:putative membrane protein